MQKVIHIENRNSSADQSIMETVDQKRLSHNTIEENRVAQNEQTSTTEKQLNPFALPSETDSRFNLFAIAAVMWVLNWTVMIGAWLEMANDDSASTQTAEVSSGLWLQIGMPAAIIILAVILYFLHPQRIIRRQQLQSFDPMKDAAFSQAIERLSIVTELPKLPKVMLNQTKRIGGQVFGLRGRYILRLDDGLRLALRKAPATFRAIVLHELAHIANRDIGRTYFSQALWTATVWLTIAPLLLVLSYELIGSRLPLLLDGSFTAADLQKLLRVSLPDFLFILFQCCIGLLLVAAIRASLLRVRETYADLRVATWESKQPLINILKRSAPSQPLGFDWKDRLRRVLRLHPTYTERINFLQEPHRLFIMAYDIPLFVGWLTSTIIIGAAQLYIPLMSSLLQSGNAFVLILDSYVQSNSSELIANLMPIVALLTLLLVITVITVPFMLIAYLALQPVGIQVLRAMLRDLFLKQRGFDPYARLLLSSILLAVGLYLGILTSSYARPLLSIDHVFLVTVRGIVLSALLLWLCMAGLRYVGGRILGFHTGKQAPVWKWRILFIMFSLVLGGLIMLFMIVQYRLFAENGQNSDAMQVAEWESMLWIMFFAVALVVFLSSWVWVKLWHWLRPARCPQCNMRTAHTSAIGQVCHSCGAELTPWLLVTKPVVV